MPVPPSPEPDARANAAELHPADASSGDTKTLSMRLREFPGRLNDSRRLRMAVVGAIFAVTTFAYLWQSLLGLGTLAAVDMNELGDPYRSAIDRPPVVASVVQTDQVEAIPYIVAFTDGLKDFEYRLWDPSVAAGVPLGSIPTFLMVSPFNAAFLATPPWYAIGLKVALQFLAGQIFMYLFLRRLNVGVLPAALGAVIYVFSGTNIVLLHRMTATFVVPGALWAALRAVEAPRARNIGLLALFIGWGWLEGFPSGWAYLVYLTVGWVAWLVLKSLFTGLREGAPGVWLRAVKGAGAGIAGLVGGTLLVAFTMIPFVVELIDRGTFEGRVAAAAVAPLRPGQLLGLVDGSTLGEWASPDYNWWSGTNPVESVALLGAITAVLVVVGYAGAAFGRLRLSSNARSAWTLLSLSALLLTIATYFGTPVLTLVNSLPGLAGNPVNRTRFIAALAAATVAAMTVDWIATRPTAAVKESRTGPILRAPRIVSVVMLIVIVVTAVLALRDWVKIASAVGELRSSATSFMWLVAISVVVVAIGVAVSRSRTAAPWAVIGLTAVAFVQLAVPYYGFTPTAPTEDFYEATDGHEAISDLAEDDYRFAATGLTTFYPNGAQVVGPPDLRGAAMHSEEFKALVRTINPVAFDRDAFKVIMSRAEWDLSAPALDHLAVKYFALDTREAPFGAMRDFSIETTTGTIGGLGPYALAGGTDNLGSFVVEVDESTSASRIQRTGPETETAYLTSGGIIGARVAVGDLDGAVGDEVLIVPSGPGTDLEVFNASGRLLETLTLERGAAPGGWWPSIGDVDGDGHSEIVLGSGAGAPPTVTVLSSDGAFEAEFNAYDPAFHGGVTTAVGDVDGDGIDEIVVGPGSGGGPHVRVFDRTGGLEFDFFAYDLSYTGGVAVAVGDPAAGGGDEIIAASLDGSQPVRVFAEASHIATITPDVASYYRITATDVAGDARDEILIGGDAPMRAAVSVVAADGDLSPTGWMPLAGTTSRSLVVSGPFSGLAIALSIEDECEAGVVAVGVRDEAGTVHNESERQLGDIDSGWTTFAIDGSFAGAGSIVDVVVEERSDCGIEIGSGIDGAAPAIRWIDPDPETPLVSTEQAWIYERPTAWPLVSAHGEWRRYETQAEALEGMVADPATIAYVGPASDIESGGPAPRVVESEVSHQGAVAVTDGPAGGLVVFSQNDALGWRAYVDGVETDHVSVDGALLGVIVPPGRHTVEFEYLPSHFLWGVAVSSGTVLVFALVAVVVRVRGRGRQDQQHARSSGGSS